MDTEEVSWPAKSKLKIKSRICSVERLECFKTHPRRSSSSKFSLLPSFIFWILSSILFSINFRMVDLDCEKAESIKQDTLKPRLCSKTLWIIVHWGQNKIVTCKAFLYAVPGKFKGADTTPFMKVTYSFFSCSVSGTPGSMLMICFAIKLKVNCNFC